jgi:hypothetical protein
MFDLFIFASFLAMVFGLALVGSFQGIRTSIREA